MTNHDTDWRVGRNNGRWGAFFSQNVGNFGCAMNVPVRFRLPAAVTGESAAITDWTPYRGKDADLQDGFIAPTGDVAIRRGGAGERASYDSGRRGRYGAMVYRHAHSGLDRADGKISKLPSPAGRQADQEGLRVK